MPEPAALLPFVLLGLLGSVHCAGMCGGFALGVAAGGPRGRALGRLGLYALGKALTYAALGLLAARAAHAAHVTEGGPALAGPAAAEGAPRDLAVAAGAFLVLAGLAQLGLRLPRPELAFTRALARALAPLLAAARSLGGWAAALGTGALTGLLPCGLSWSALALATQVGPGTAAAGLFAFGLATAPALAAVGWGGLLVAGRRRGRGLRVAAGLVLLAFGLLVALRGLLPAAPAALRSALPGCCAESAAD